CPGRTGSSSTTSSRARNLKKEGVKAGKDNVCANLIMLSAITNNWISDRRPSAYLKDLADWHGEDVLRERLRTCLIEEDASQAALRDDSGSFLRARSETLHRRLMELVGSAAGSSGDGDVFGPSPDLEPDPPVAAGSEPFDRDSVD